MSEERKKALGEAIKTQMAEMRDKLKGMKEEMGESMSEISEDMMKDRKTFNSILEGLSHLFDDLPAMDSDIFEPEYNIISTDAEDTFMVVYFHPKTSKATISSAHKTREDALNKLKDIVENKESDKITEEVKSE